MCQRLLCFNYCAGPPPPPLPVHNSRCSLIVYPCITSPRPWQNPAPYIRRRMSGESPTSPHPRPLPQMEQQGHKPKTTLTNSIIIIMLRRHHSVTVITLPRAIKFVTRDVYEIENKHIIILNHTLNQWVDVTTLTFCLIAVGLLQNFIW